MNIKLALSSFIAAGIFASTASADAHADKLLKAASATKQIEQSLARIKEFDNTYQAVISISPTATQDAHSFDQTPVGFLQGMPILVKDNIDSIGLPTTAGSLALKDNYPSADAPSIAQLKNSGAIILGKTNLSEWANFRSEKSSSGWSAVGGQTRNAHDITRSPCGSSSGSAVAVALGYVPVAIGTETHGSIICPATSNGVVGFKPTHGIVNGAGIVPLASSQDTAGPIANNIENASAVLAAMIDPETKNHQALIAGLKQLEGKQDTTKLRIGILSSTLNYDPRRDTLFDNAIVKLKAAGVEIIEDVQLEPYAEFWDENYQLLQYEFKRDLDNYFAALDNDLQSMTLAKLIEFNRENAAQELIHFDQNIFELSQALAISEKQYNQIRARGHRTTREDGLEKVFKQHHLDAIIGISGGPAWLIDHINGDSFFGPGMSGYAAIGGYPHITVPGGKIAGMPMGISFIGKRYQDHVLAQIVFEYTKLN